MDFVDLFSGAGGLSEGLSEAGFHCLFANEINPVYARTFAGSHREAKVTTADIRTIDADRIRLFPDHFILYGSMAEQFAQVGIRCSTTAGTDYRIVNQTIC